MSDTGIYPSAKDFAERERIGARADAILKEMVDEAMGDLSRLVRALKDEDSYDLARMIANAIYANSIGHLNNAVEGHLAMMWRDKAMRQAEGGG